MPVPAGCLLNYAMFHEEGICSCRSDPDRSCMQTADVLNAFCSNRSHTQLELTPTPDF